MIPTAYIMMYSGLQNPEKELSQEEVDTLKDLVSKLDHPFPGATNSHMGFSGYSASLSDELYVIASLWGYIQVFRANGEMVAFSDTTGVLAYLCKLMTPVMIRHNEDAAQAMDDWVTYQLTYTPEPWEPQF